MTDNLRIWSAVEKTDPKFTKHVGQRGGFTAISANYQIKMATEQFGPIGIGWGYDCGLPIFHETLVMVPVTFWHGARENRFGPIYGCEEWKDSKGRIDSDATKKAETDGLTKALSRLGFNADVFMGLYDDQKYVESVKREFANKTKASELFTDAQRDEIVVMAQGAGVTLQALLKKASDNLGATYTSLKDLPATEFAPMKAMLQARMEQRASQKDAA